MAAAGRRALAMANFLQDLRQASVAARRAFVASYERHLFPHLGTSTAQTKWWTFRNVTRVTLWGHDHFRNNVRLFMVMEALDLGPSYYCVMRTINPGFTERLFLLLQFLPHQKMYVYPYFGLPFRGPFDRSVRLSQMGFEIYRRRLPLGEMPNYCPACNDCFCDHAMDGLAVV